MKYTTIDIVNNLTFIALAIFVALGINESVEQKDQLLAYVILFVLSCVFFLRKLPVIDVIWFILKMAIVGLFVAIFADYAKKEVKEWWNK
jgi:cell division protein FtsW (lipid II flippase)